jgi:hypothetical protein
LLASLRISEVTTLSTGTLVCRFTVGMMVAPGGTPSQAKREKSFLVQTTNLDQLRHKKLLCSKFPCDMRRASPSSSRARENVKQLVLGL